MIRFYSFPLMATLAILDTNDFIIQQNPTPTLLTEISLMMLEERNSSILLIKVVSEHGRDIGYPPMALNLKH